MSKILKNTTQSDILISALGVNIATAGQYTVNASDYGRLSDSDQIVTLVGNGSIVVNDGTTDLAAAKAMDLIKGAFPSSLSTVVTAQPDPAPFAAPTFRTKRDGSNTIVTIAPSATVNIDYTLAEERYVHGGQIVVKNAQIGDYVSANIVDVNGVIPEAYRAALCEAWPVVATYIIREWVPFDGIHTINTYPLNAKVTPGLVLRVAYTACADGTDRKAGITYYLTKKL